MSGDTESGLAMPARVRRSEGKRESNICTNVASVGSWVRVGEDVNMSTMLPTFSGVLVNIQHQQLVEFQSTFPGNLIG